jgi:type II secretory pathway component PulK
MPTIVSESRKESALKYMGLWASSKVNINTAPRQVLEAAFTFGGDADKIAKEIIQRRRIKPFTDIEDLRKSLYRYSDSIGKCEKYITTTSRFFTIKITAVSGVAEASTVIAIIKDGKSIVRIAAISG